MNTLEKIIFALISVVFSAQALAHPGHDHSSWTASPIHAVFYFSIAAAVVLAAVFFANKALKNKKDQTKN